MGKLKDKEQAVIDCYLSGHSLKQTADIFKVCPNTVARLLAHKGIKTRSVIEGVRLTGKIISEKTRRYSDKEEFEICAYYLQGNSLRETAKKFQTRDTTITGILRRRNISTRSMSEGCKISRRKNQQAVLNPTIKQIRKSAEYAEWRLAVFRRDNFTCVWCGAKAKKGEIIIHSDHIKPFQEYPESRFDVDNGRTLCWDCHKKTDSYGWKAVNEKRRSAMQNTNN